MKYKNEKFMLIKQMTLDISALTAVAYSLVSLKAELLQDRTITLVFATDK